MNLKVKEWFKSAKAISFDLRAHLQKHSYHTGSYVFGGFNKENSDIDLMINAKTTGIDFDDLVAEGGYYCEDYWESEHYQSIYLKFRINDPVPVNVLLFHDVNEFKVWFEATNTLRDMIIIERFGPLMQDKKQRVAMFELLKDFYR